MTGRLHFWRAALLVALSLESSGQRVTQWHVKIPLRDGVRLCGNVFLPSAGGAHSAVLQRTPYGKPSRPAGGIQAFLEAGYAVVVVDVRGRNHSEGVFRQFEQEEADGYDTVAWIARQPWSDQRVGMFGGSYSGISAWRAALARPPALKAVAVAVAGGDEYLDRFYSPGGALRLAHRTRWIAENYTPPNSAVADFRKTNLWLPLRTADIAAAGRRLDFWRAAVEHPAYDNYWAVRSTRSRIPAAALPAHVTAGWYDPFLDSDIDMFLRLRRAGKPARMLIGPWGHSQSQPMLNASFGGAPLPSPRASEIEWFKAFLEEVTAAPASVIRYFLMGANEWRESPVWPPPETGTAQWYLTSRRGANSLKGDGALEERPPAEPRIERFTYHPRNAVPTVGGALCCNFKLHPWGPLDQRPVESRSDVLVFTSAPRKRPLDIAGPVRAILYAASDAADTDFTAKLVDVAPDGNARILADGIVRMRYRQGVQREIPYTPGAIERIEIALGSTAHRFLAGHSIRLDVSSSNFPRFDRNLNTGRPQAGEREMRQARQTVHLSRERPSALLLPAF
jgi:hypothetical protein